MWCYSHFLGLACSTWFELVLFKNICMAAPFSSNSMQFRLLIYFKIIYQYVFLQMFCIAWIERLSEPLISSKQRIMGYGSVVHNVVCKYHSHIIKFCVSQ